jgi:hypothetical protein
MTPLTGLRGAGRPGREGPSRRVRLYVEQDPSSIQLREQGRWLAAGQAACDVVDGVV